jgi:hypothetical protein
VRQGRVDLPGLERDPWGDAPACACCGAGRRA